VFVIAAARFRLQPMPERDDDPIANTQMFRAFANSGDAQPARRRPGAVLPVAAVLVLVAVAVVVWLLAR
jgi:hypothetical protein